MNRISKSAVCGASIALWAAAGFSAAARADIVFSQLPIFHQGGGYGDTEFLWGNTPFWQRSAEDFTLNTPALIGHVRWWSYYGTAEDTAIEQPPTTQTIRLRLYDSRPVDDLPGRVLFEESLVDPPRIATGEYVHQGADPPEFRYDVDLNAAWQISANTRYWLEIVQIGLPNSHYRWELAWPPNETSFAFINPITGDWRLSSSYAVAFEISTIPEPAALIMFTVVLLSHKRSVRR